MAIGNLFSCREYGTRFLDLINLDRIVFLFDDSCLSADVCWYSPIRISRLVFLHNARSDKGRGYDGTSITYLRATQRTSQLEAIKTIHQKRQYAEIFLRDCQQRSWKFS